MHQLGEGPRVETALPPPVIDGLSVTCMRETEGQKREREKKDAIFAPHV
jgi:hypothetical protein